MATENGNNFPDRILSIAEVVLMTGLSEATIWREIQADRFPKPVVISPRRRGWRLSDLMAWLESRPSPS